MKSEYNTLVRYLAHKKASINVSYYYFNKLCQDHRCIFRLFPSVLSPSWDRNIVLKGNFNPLSSLPTPPSNLVQLLPSPHHEFLHLPPGSSTMSCGTSVIIYIHTLFVFSPQYWFVPVDTISLTTLSNSDHSFYDPSL